MAFSTQSISGIISGLDTSAIIEQLMQIEGRYIVRMQQRIQLNQLKLSAWTSLSARLLTLSNYSAILNRSATYRATSATSSDEDILAPVLTGTPQIGTYPLKVYQRAQTHQIISRGYSDTDTASVGIGTIVIELGEGFVDRKTPLEWINGQTGFYRGSIKITDRSGTSASIDLTGALTMQDVIDAINNNTTINVTASVEDNPSYNLGDALKLVDNTGQTTSNFKVEEVGGGTTSSDLGILADVAATEIHGDDINDITWDTSLDLLNGGTGVYEGSIKITDRVGNIDTIDLSSATTLQDVKDLIEAGPNTNINVLINADTNGITIDDTNGSPTQNLIIEEVGSDSTAQDLGIYTGAAGVAGDKVGDRIISGLNTVLLKILNGGGGVGSVTGDDFQVQMRNGSTFNIDISGDETLQEVIDSINNAAGNTNVTVSYDRGGHALLLTDTSSGSNNLEVTVLNSSSAASNLGILKSLAASTLEGDDLNPQYIARSSKLSTLNGGEGVDAAKIKITDRAGNSEEIDLSTAKTIGEVLAAINNASGISVLARVNSEGNGIEILDLSGDSTGALTVEEVSSGTAARDLNILDSATASQAIPGSDVNYIAVTTLLDILNDGTGIASGSIIITDRSGATDTIDLSTATTLQDVITAINAGANTDVTASINATGDGIDIVDNTGQADYNLKVEESGSSTAADLGIKQDLSSSKIYGDQLLPDLQTTYLKWLNGQAGVSSGKIKITDRSGAYSEIDLSSARTLQDVIDAINNDTTINVTASIEDNPSYNLGDALKLVDNTGETTSNFKVEEVGGATASGLGILADVAATEIHGNDINSIVLSTKLAVLRDLTGINVVGGDDLRITARDGTTIDVDISSSSTVQDVIDAINNDAENIGNHITASILPNGNGIRIVDNVGGGSNLSLVNLNGSTTASDLGIEKSVASSTLDGDDIIPDLNQTWLESLKDGNGVTAGSIRITDRSGATDDLDLSSYTTLQEVLDAISNDTNVSVTASLDSSKNEIVITDQSGGTGLLKIEEVAHDTAGDLGILETTGTGPTGIDGSFETVVSITTENNTLEGLRDAINAAKAGVQVSIINDGSSIDPYRLVIVSSRSGTVGRMSIDPDLSGGIEPAFFPTSQPQDAVVVLGEGTENPVLITDTSNKMSDVISGLTLNIVEADPSKIVQVKIVTDITGIITDITNFLDSYNQIMEFINTHQSYDADAEKVGGVLFGEVSLMNVRNDLRRLITDPIEGSSSITSMFQLGITTDLTGQLSLDKAKLTKVLTEDLEGVKDLFSLSSNIASNSFEAVASASSQYSTNYNVASVNNGDTSSLNWGTPGGGWRDAVPGSFPDYLTITFDSRRALRKIKIYTLDSQTYPASTYGIKDYQLQYLKRGGDPADDNDWETITTVAGHADGTVTHYLSRVTTTAIRLKIDASNGANDYSRIIELEAYQDVGLSGRINSYLRYATDATDGSIAIIEDSLNAQIEDQENQIASQEKLMDIKKERLIRQFSALEKYLARMQVTSLWLTQQISMFNRSPLGT